MINLIQGDCLEKMKDIPDRSIDLIVADPPYNTDKAEWDKIDNYLEWCGNWVRECGRVLSCNGSLYWFHNNMPTVAKLMVWIEANTAFCFKQLIIWNKRFDDAYNKGYLDGYVAVLQNRNYLKMAEYCLYYTFQDRTGLGQVYENRDCFTNIKEYLRKEKVRAGLTSRGVNVICGVNSVAGGHYFCDSQWRFPTAEMYTKLQTTGYFQRSYESLREEYESLREEYESLRYTFNNNKYHSVWNFETIRKREHPTQKPIALMENIIRHSSNSGDLVLDPFMGSGTTGVACVNLGRDFIGIELDEKYFAIAEKRINENLFAYNDKARVKDS